MHQRERGLIEALLKAGADANERLPNGETALMMASRTGNVAAMKVLLDHGADVNAKETLRGTTALMWAAAQGHPAAVQLLIERGADVSARSNPDADSRRAGGRWRDGCRSEAVQKRRGVEMRARSQGRIRAWTATAGPAGRTQSDGGGLTPLVFASAAQRSRVGAGSAGGRRRCEPSHGVWLEPIVGGDPESVLPARVVPAGQGRGPEHRQQGRLDAPVSRRG